jgi:hypothetical protein
VAAAALSADTAWKAVERVLQEVGSRREGRRSGAKTEEDEEAMATASCLVRAGGTSTLTILSRRLIFSWTRLCFRPRRGGRTAELVYVYGSCPGDAAEQSPLSQSAGRR